MKCEECGLAILDNDFTNHIEREHDLAEYISKHGLDSLFTKTEETTMTATKKTTKKKATKKTTVKVDDSLKHAIPELDENYTFQPITKEVIYDYQCNTPVMLIGQTGTGKTSMINQLAAKIGQPVVRANMNGQTSISDFVGFYGAKGGETYWVDGVLPYAMRNGMWLIIDEIDYAEAEILSVLNAVLEDKGCLVLKEKGNELVCPHENFRIFATANTAGAMSEFRSLYQGTNIMNEAFLDRWSIHMVDYMQPENEIKVVVGKAEMPDAMAKEMVKVANMVRKAFTEEEVNCTFSTRRLINWAKKTMYYAENGAGDNSPMLAATSTIFNKISPEDSKIVTGIIQRVLVGTTDQF